MSHSIVHVTYTSGHTAAFQLLEAYLLLQVSHWDESEG
jgi:hypothetical protein